MTSVAGVDHPGEQTEAEVSIGEHGLSVSCRVEEVRDDVLSVRPSVGEYAGQDVARTGDRVEVFWRTPDDQRLLPAEVIGTDTGAVVRWRLRATGPAERSQRRTAVRAAVGLPVEVGHGSVELVGETLDLSEAGLRAQVEGFGIPPGAGDEVDLRIELGDGDLQAKAEIVRQHVRGTRWMLSLRLVGVSDRDQDRVRRRVFQALREARAKLAE